MMKTLALSEIDAQLNRIAAHGDMPLSVVSTWMARLYLTCGLPDLASAVWDSSLSTAQRYIDPTAFEALLKIARARVLTGPETVGLRVSWSEPPRPKLVLCPGQQALRDEFDRVTELADDKVVQMASRQSNRSELDREHPRIASRLVELAATCGEHPNMIGADGVGGFVGFRGMVWKQVTVRRECVCWLTGAQIHTGHKAWRQLSHMLDRGRRIKVGLEGWPT